MLHEGPQSLAIFEIALHIILLVFILLLLAQIRSMRNALVIREVGGQMCGVAYGWRYDGWVVCVDFVIGSVKCTRYKYGNGMCEHCDIGKSHEGRSLHLGG